MKNSVAIYDLQICVLFIFFAENYADFGLNQSKIKYILSTMRDIIIKK